MSTIDTSNSYYESLLTSSSDSSVTWSTAADATEITSEDFLTLLVTELECQDPTDPMDNTEMVNQLTQYSQLDELTSMNEKLETLTDSLTSMTTTNSVSYLGKEVEASGYTVTKSGDDVSDLYFELEDYAQSLTCNIYDEDGSIVDSVIFTEVEAGTHSFTWDGTDYDGESLADGTYTVLMTGTDSSGDSVDVTTTTTGTVTGISNTDDGVVLVLDDGRTVNLADVTYVTS